MTGYSAQKALKDRPGVSAALIQRHQSAALVALLMEANGRRRLVRLWQGKKPTGASRWNAPVVLLLATVTIGLMASAANIGGRDLSP
jgi:hypothetical protein